MKVGDLVKWVDHVGFVLKVSSEGGTIKVLHGGTTKWWVTSGCEVINGR